MFDIASTVSVSSQPLYLWSLTNCMYDITPSLHMTSYAPYIRSHPLFMTSHHCSHHVTTTAFMTSHTLHMTSHTWQHKRYICHHTHYIWHYIHCIWFIKPSVSIIPHLLSGWHHTHYMYDVIFSMHGITWTLYDITPLYVWYRTHYINDIISNIYDITHTAFMTTQQLYLTFHPLYLTSQPLYHCCQNRWIDDITTSKEVIPLGISMTSYTFYMKSHSQFMISMLSIYDITATAFMTSGLLYMTSHPWFMTSYPLYLWHHPHSTCVITPNVSYLSNPVYVWHHSHYMYDIICTA